MGDIKTERKELAALTYPCMECPGVKYCNTQGYGECEALDNWCNSQSSDEMDHMEAKIYRDYYTIRDDGYSDADCDEWANEKVLQLTGGR